MWSFSGLYINHVDLIKHCHLTKFCLLSSLFTSRSIYFKTTKRWCHQKLEGFWWRASIHFFTAFSNTFHEYFCSQVTSSHAKTANILSSNHELNNYSCYYEAVNAYHSNCFNLGCNDYALRQVGSHSLMTSCKSGFFLFTPLFPLSPTWIRHLLQIHANPSIF